MHTEGMCSSENREVSKKTLFDCKADTKGPVSQTMLPKSTTALYYGLMLVRIWAA